MVRGEDHFPSGVLRVSDCHDTVVYALAPLQYAKIAACSDCTVRSPGGNVLLALSHAKGFGDSGKAVRVAERPLSA